MSQNTMSQNATSQYTMSQNATTSLISEETVFKKEASNELFHLPRDHTCIPVIKLSIPLTKQ